MLNKISIYPSSKDITLLREIKNRELAALEPDAPSVSIKKLSSVEQTTRSITDMLDAKLGTSNNSIGGTINRMAVSALHVVGDIAGMVGADESGQTLRNANSDLTNRDLQTKAAIQKSGYQVPLVARVAQEAENTLEFLHDIIEGATLGDFSRKETFGATAGKIIGGLNPAGDVRDIAANTKDAAQGKKGSSVGLTASMIGAIPIMGDIAKPAIKANKEIIAEGAEALLKQTDDVAAQTAKEAAEKAAKEHAEKISKRYDELDARGHAPARHGEQVTETQLDDRAMFSKDPITGTTDDAFNKFPDGTPRLHNAGKNATKFTSKESLVKGEEYARSTQKYKNEIAQAEAIGDNYITVNNIELEDVYGAKYKDDLFGKTRIGSKNNPTGTVETDFTDGTLTAKFKKDSSGNWNLDTMFPEPK